MSTPEVTVVDYGMGNLLSVRRALEHCGAEVTLSSSGESISSARRVLLPGVGAFGDGMAELTRRGLDVVLRAVAAQGTPLLGICLGMQMLLDASEEFEVTPGLGLISGNVTLIPSITVNGSPQKIPHIGWSALERAGDARSWTGTLLHDTTPGDAVYFVHSFMASPTDSSDRIADSFYGGVPVAAVIGRENVFGCQFHPEKSGEVGLRILRKFLTL